MKNPAQKDSSRARSGGRAPAVANRLLQGALGLLVLTFALAFIAGCDSYLDQEPVGVLFDDDIYSDESLTLGVMSNYYARLADPFYKNLEGDPFDWAYIDEALYSGNGGGFQNGLGQYIDTEWGLYEGGAGYGLIGDINQTLVALQDPEGPARELGESTRTRFIAETRFLRAFMHFELVKRMGGVPIVTQQYTYDGPESVPDLQLPRNTEKEVYDFVADELDAVMDDLPAVDSDKSRANRWTAKAVKARAMLYAASIARYNSQKTPDVQISSAPNIVGMTDADPDEYYERALAAAEDILNNSPYGLYQAGDDPRERFYNAVISKAGNPEVMWVTDYDGSDNEAYGHSFNFFSMPRSARDVQAESASVSPSLDLVEAFGYRDSTQASGDIQTCQDAEVEGNCVENGSDFVYFDEQSGPFENKDPRLWGSIIYPGSTFRGAPLDFQTGVAVWNDTTGSYNFISGNLGSTYEGDGGRLTGLDGPLDFEPNTSNTGFYLRKYISTVPGSGLQNQSNTWWVRFRYGEILLIAAEAALELGQESKALGYVNELRDRAEMPEYESLTMDDVKQERRVELAFEEHRLWDLRRWRDAHEVWNGTEDSDDALIDGMYLYRVVRPGDAEKDGKYIYVQRRAFRHQFPRFFRLRNYYAAFSQETLNRNPNLVRNPFY